MMTGSHLDTQPTGGKFDGAYGVMAGLEVLRVLHDSGYVTEAPIEVAVWTNEEGCRFAPAMVASGVFGGAFTLEHALGIKDRDGVSFGEALKKIGYDGKEPVGGRPVGAFFEAHIEQGPILERENKTIGVVTGAQGQRWYEVYVDRHGKPRRHHADGRPPRRAGRRGRADRRVPPHRQPAERPLDHRRDRKPAAVAQHHSRAACS